MPAVNIEFPSTAITTYRSPGYSYSLPLAALHSFYYQNTYYGLPGLCSIFNHRLISCKRIEKNTFGK